jgi:hypothetical protein
MPSFDAEQGFEAPMWPVSLHLAHTKRVSVTAPDRPCSSTAARVGTLARLAMNATGVSKSVQTDHIIAYSATNLVLTCAVPWLHQKEIKSIEARSVQQMAKSNKAAIQNPKPKGALAVASASKQKLKLHRN